MHILLAEDHPVLRQLTTMLLDAWGYDYDVAVDGAAAVALAQENPGKYDLGLFDVEMPYLRGDEATRIIRKTTRYFPIVAVTAGHFEQRCEAAGMDDFLAKPYAPEVLCDRIRVLTVKLEKFLFNQDKVELIKETPMNQTELKELIELKKQGLTKLKLVGTDHAFVVHKNIQNKISYDLIAEGKEVSEFIDRSGDEPGRCHLYKLNLHVTKDLFIPEELKKAIKQEDEIVTKFDRLFDQEIKK